MRIFAFAASAFILTAASAHAQDRLAIDGSLGTTGLGANLQFKIQERVVLRGGINYLEYDVADENYDGVDYDVSLSMSNASGFLDLHPFANGFVMSAGVYGGENKEATLEATPIADVEIGDLIFTPEQVGILTGEVTLSDMSPYLGIGWDGSLYAKSRVNFLIRAGAMFTGSPDVELSSERGTFSDDPIFQAQLQIEEENLEDEIETFAVYPVLNIGLSLRF